jgi:large subunit ribosomal protein L3
MRISRKNRKAILGKKLGMTQIFQEDGRQVPVTVLQAGPCTILQVKTPKTDGYRAYQLGFEERKKEAKKPQQAHYDRIGVTPKRFLREIPYIDEADLLPSPEAMAASQTEPDAGGSEAAESAPETGGGDAAVAAELKAGAQIGVSVFRGIGKVDVQGIVKGRGFTGVIKRHGFSSGDRTHGGKSYRRPGSTGQHTDPGRVFKGKRMPGQHGACKRKIRNLEVVHLYEEKNLLLVRGAIPGPTGGFVYIEESLLS